MTERPRPPPRLESFRPSGERAGRARPPIAQQRERIPGLTPHRAGPPRRRGGWLGFTLWSIAGLFVLAGLAAGALALFAPVGLVRDQLVREIKARTGRDLVVAGPTSLSFYPSLGVTMTNVTLSAPPTMGGTPFVRMKRLAASVAALPLLQRLVEIERLVLTEPVFELRSDAQGRRSWDFAELAGPPRIQLAQAGDPGRVVPPELADFLKNASPAKSAPQSKETSPTAAGRSRQVQDISFGDVRIENGTVRYRDERTGVAEEFGQINARVTGKSLAAPVDLKGSLVLRGEKVDIDTRLTTPKAMIEQRPVRIGLALSSAHGTARYDGTLGPDKSPQLEGAIKVDTPSLRRFASWIGATLPDNGGLGAMSLKADIKTGPTGVSLGNTEARLDDTTATGTVDLDLVVGRPMIKANLRVSALDLNRYMPPPGATAAQRAAPAGPAAARDGSPTIDDIIRQSGGAAPKADGSPAQKSVSPQVRGFEGRTGWSEDRLDLAPLGLADADIRLALAGLTWRQLKLGATQLVLGLQDGALKTTIEDTRLYDGQGRGVVTLEGGSRTPAVGISLALDGVSGLPLLKDAAGFDWVAGKAKVQIAVAGHGGSQKAIMESLAGKADFAFADGAIVGINVPQMVRNIGQGRFSGFNRTPTETTDFSEAAASFQIKAGVADTRDLRLAGPLMRMTGTGTIGLGQRQVDLTVRSRVVASLAGQGGAIDASGLDLPVRIRGPWERPSIAPDLDAVLKDPGKAVEAVKEIGRQLQSKGVIDEQTKARAKELLQNFLKR